MRLLAVSAVSLLLAGCGSPEQPDAAQGGQAAKVVAAPAAMAKGRFAPRDECRQMPGAVDFREQLVEAVQVRNAAALAALADPAIKLDFGGGGGVETLKQRLNSGPELWQSLAQLMTLGCAKSGAGEMVMPWVFSLSCPDSNNCTPKFETLPGVKLGGSLYVALILGPDLERAIATRRATNRRPRALNGLAA